MSAFSLWIARLKTWDSEPARCPILHAAAAVPPLLTANAPIGSSVAAQPLALLGLVCYSLGEGESSILELWLVALGRSTLLLLVEPPPKRST